MKLDCFFLQFITVNVRLSTSGKIDTFIFLLNIALEPYQLLYNQQIYSKDKRSQSLAAES